MEYAPKIHRYSSKVENDMHVTESALVSIYRLMTSSSLEETTTEEMINAVKKQFNFKEKKSKAWKTLRKLIIGEAKTATQRSRYSLDGYNEEMLLEMNKELAPFVKEFLLLAREQEIKVRIMAMPEQNRKRPVSLSDFGLGFDIGVFEESLSGDLIYVGNILQYEKLARIAESIGLSQTAEKVPVNFSRFELRPAWALRLTDEQMFVELKRRKKIKMNFLSMNE